MKTEGANEVWARVAAFSADVLEADASLLVLSSGVVAVHNLASQSAWQQQLLETSFTSDGPFAWKLPEGARLVDGREAGRGMATRLEGTSGRLGVLAMLRSSGREPFGPQDLRRLAALGTLLGLGIEAQLGVETAISLMAALGEVSLPGDTQGLLERALEGVARTLGASGASLMLLSEEGDLVIRAAWGLPDDVVRGARRRLGEGISGYVVESGEPLLLGGPVQDQRFRGVDPAIDGAISVPLRGSDGVIGALNLRRKSVGAAFSPKELRMALGLARALGGALEQIRQAERVQEDRRQALALYELGRMGRESNDIGELLARALAMAADFLEAPIGMVAEKDGESRWKVLARRGFEESGEWESTALERVLHERRAVRLHGKELANERWPWWQSKAAYVGVPLEVGQTRGVLVLGRGGDRGFGVDDMGFAEALGIEISAIWEQARKKHGQGVQVAAAERQRIAQELHDGLAQELSGVLLAIEGSQMALARDPAAAQRQLAKAARGARECLRDVRRYMMTLRLEEESQGDLVWQLGQLVEEARRQGLAVEMRVEGDRDKLALKGDALRTLLRVAQEALANVRKHAQARKTSVVLVSDGEVLELQIEDDGVGFAVEQVMELAPKEGRYGLLGMRERAEFAGGLLRVQSEPGRGTRVELRLPRVRPPEHSLTLEPPNAKAEPTPNQGALATLKPEPEVVKVRDTGEEPGRTGLIHRLPALFKK